MCCDIGENLGSCLQSAGYLCEHAVGDSHAYGYSLEASAFSGPHLILSIRVADGLIFVEHSFTWCEPESLAGYSYDVLDLEGIDDHVGCESGLELEVLVGSADDHFIGDHVAFSGGLLSYLCDFTLEGVIGEGIHGEVHSLSFSDVTYVGFVHVGYHSHVGEVTCYLEEGGGVVA